MTLGVISSARNLRIRGPAASGFAGKGAGAYSMGLTPLARYFLIGKYPFPPAPRARAGFEMVLALGSMERYWINAGAVVDAMVAELAVSFAVLAAGSSF